MHTLCVHVSVFGILMVCGVAWRRTPNAVSVLMHFSESHCVIKSSETQKANRPTTTARRARNKPALLWSRVLSQATVNLDGS